MAYQIVVLHEMETERGGGSELTDSMSRLNADYAVLDTNDTTGTSWVLLENDLSASVNENSITVKEVRSDNAARMLIEAITELEATAIGGYNTIADAMERHLKKQAALYVAYLAR